MGPKMSSFILVTVKNYTTYTLVQNASGLQKMHITLHYFTNTQKNLKVELFLFYPDMGFNSDYDYFELNTQ